ncbi:hypothetical protein M231_04950 [Tremella mesenterica]|uniref:Uncharacterized protein n=1 Tax=Tremella mesenterica TaxID=5217 RepID=A0A4Q1BJB4_TREME|nr:uncharacterized protein TREMEDRAFT_58425 [Tremella mesenterica DSM 1558]EIW72266.1 hypothetical protein TREMEDRAFT_58425 [Tremella mesenterica DSM 1558]RXK37794.1 hypothetical protein M231_04950 [Tremella mesenterica]
MTEVNLTPVASDPRGKTSLRDLAHTIAKKNTGLDLTFLRDWVETSRSPEYLPPIPTTFSNPLEQGEDREFLTVFAPGVSQDLWNDADQVLQKHPIDPTTHTNLWNEDLYEMLEIHNEASKMMRLLNSGVLREYFKRNSSNAHPFEGLGSLTVEKVPGPFRGYRVIYDRDGFCHSLTHCSFTKTSSFHTSRLSDSTKDEWVYQQTQKSGQIVSLEYRGKHRSVLYSFDPLRSSLSLSVSDTAHGPRRHYDAKVDGKEKGATSTPDGSVVALGGA